MTHFVNEQMPDHLRFCSIKFHTIWASVEVKCPGVAGWGGGGGDVAWNSLIH